MGALNPTITSTTKVNKNQSNERPMMEVMSLLVLGM